MRADAAANRQRVLAAAEAVFAERGVAASTEDVARQAGVGVGTVFRHFPTKRELVESVMLARFAEVTELARDAETRPDATDAFFELLEQLLALIAHKRALARYLFDGTGLTEPVAHASAELLVAIASVLRRAQTAGGVRQDVGIDELTVLIVGLAGSGTGGAGAATDAARRQAGRVVIDGLRAGRCV